MPLTNVLRPAAPRMSQSAGACQALPVTGFCAEPFTKLSTPCTAGITPVQMLAHSSGDFSSG
jgi:hypothetical protein